MSSPLSTNNIQRLSRGQASAKPPRGLASWKHWIPGRRKWRHLSTAFAGMTIAILVFTFSISLYPEPVEGALFSTSQKIATSTANTVTGQPNLSSGLVGYWTFDGKDVVRGVLQDKSGNGNNGNLINIATSTFFAQGKIGQAGKFDGGMIM